MASTRPPNAPTAAASEGVAKPARIAPSTERIRNASGKNEVSTMNNTRPNDRSPTSSSRGLGAIDGFRIDRPIT